MFRKNLGNAVASEMEAVLASDEYKHYFSKEAQEKDKPAECKCPKGCECRKKGSHTAKECPCPKKGSAEEEQKKTKASIEVEAPSLKESFDNLVSKFVSLSEELDELGFDKASASLLDSFDILLKEAQGEPIEQLIEDALQTAQQAGENVEINVDIDEKEPAVESPGDERLMEGEEDFDWDATFKALDEMGLGEEAPEEGLSDEQKGKMHELGLIEKATKEVDEWLAKNASAEDLGQESTVDFELDAELSALLAEDTLDEQLVSIAEDKEDEDCAEADDEDEDDKDDKDEGFEDED